MTAGIVAVAVGGDLVWGAATRRISGFSIDTRTLAPGDLFFAIRGERFDGHDFVGDAIRAGAAGAVISDRAVIGSLGEPLEPPAIVVVADTIRALQILGHHVRRASGATVVAITGSAGKSTTKEIAAEFLAAHYRVFRSKGNLNNHIGLPLSLLELRRRPDIAVVEFGMSHSGEISTLVAIAEPEVRVWTNVAPAHLEFFDDIDAIAEAKAEILERAGRDHLLVANADDDRVVSRAQRFAGRVMTFGVERPADVRALAVRDQGIEGAAALVRTPIGEVEIRTPLVGPANLANVLAATAVAIRFEVPLADIAGRAAVLKPVPGRGEVIRLAGGVTIIDDSYNSNPAALSRVLGVVRSEDRFERRVAVLGEMLELGEDKEMWHRASGREAAAAGLSTLITVGGLCARALARAAVAAGMTGESVHHVSDSSLAAGLAASLVKPGDLVLVKGSRGVRTEVVVDRLKAEFA